MLRFPFFILLLCPMLGAVNAPIDPDFYQKRPGGKDYALFFAVENYDLPGSWKTLPGLADECRAMGRDLADLYGFEKAEVVLNPTYQDILDKLAEYRSRKFNDDDQLFIYFSGHGQYSEDEGEGFFIPRDGKSSKAPAGERRWYSLLQMPRHVNKIGCRHIFLAIDACFSGTIDPLIALKDEEWATPTTNTDERLNQYVHDLLRGQSRVLMTSGGKFRTKHPSDFSKWFRQAFSKLGGVDGLLRPNEIEDFWPLDGAERPKSGIFEGHEANGHFIFVYQPKNDAYPKQIMEISMENRPNTSNVLKADFDEDGVPDYKDKCKTQPGKAEDKGCPDSDDDGVIDIFDNCINEKGSVHNNGCPLFFDPTSVKTLDDLLIDVVSIEGGKLKVSSDAKGSNRNGVYVDNFRLAKYETTNFQFCSFLNEKGNQMDNGVEWLNVIGQYDNEKCRIIKEGNMFKSEPGYENYPITFVSWHGADAFCKWLSHKTGLKIRLPTEAEWDYASNKNHREKYAGTSEEVRLYEFANFCDENCNEYSLSLQNDGFKYAAPVGRFQPNGHGLFDMTGNVWEWCSDWYDRNYFNSRPDINPLGPTKGDFKVMRGGSWKEVGIMISAEQRGNNLPNYRNAHVGFRIAIDKD